MNLEVIKLSKDNLKNFQININELLSQFNNFDYESANEDSKMIYNSCSILIGASLGDAIGSYCEFLQPSPNNELSIWAEKNKNFGTARGQITDDTELAISLALGLLETINKLGSNINNINSINNHPQIKISNLGVNYIAFYFSFWYNSNPFDIGNTTRAALGVENSENLLDNDINDETLMNSILYNSMDNNKEKLTNGFLMRHTPMTVLLYYLNKFTYSINFQSCIDNKNYEMLFLTLIELVSDEIILTHSNPECSVAAVVYDFLILSILTQKDSQINRRRDKIQNNDEFNNMDHLHLLKDFLKALLYSKDDNIFIFLNGIKNILENLDEILNMNSFENASEYNYLMNDIGTKIIGHYKHSMNLIFFVLKFFYFFNTNNKNETYTKIMKFICNKGGDTDTNCCIVGGIVGALLGLKNFDQKYINPHLQFNSCHEKNDVKRPFIYSPSILTFYGFKLFPLIKNITNVNQIESKQNG